MSLQRFSACCKLLSGRRNISQHNQFIFQSFKGYRQNFVTKIWDQRALLGSSCSELCYSTIARPHLSKSLQKWKRRKRKSKAQRKRELETLQNDFTQLFMKRVVQLMQEDTHQYAHRQVVTTHSYTNSNTRPSTEIMEVLSTEIDLLDCLKFDASLSAVPNTRVPNHNLLTHSPQIHKLPMKETVDFKSFQRDEKQSFSPHRQESEKKTVINEIIENYLKTKQYHADTAYSSGLSDHNNSALYPTTSDVFPFSNTEKLLKLTHHKPQQSFKTKDSFVENEVTGSGLIPSEKETDHNRTTMSQNLSHISEPSAVPEGTNDFLNLFMKFQVGMMKSGHGERNWEKIDEIIHETDLASTDLAPEIVASSAFNAEPQPLINDAVEDKSSTHSSKVEELFGKDTVIKSIPKGNVSAHQMGENSLFPKRKEKITPESKLSKPRQKRKEHKDFQELLDKSFIEACCFTGNELLAVRNIEFQANRHGISSVNIFNRLIHTLAKKQNLGAIKTLFSLLRQAGVSPSLQTYAGCLECIGRMPEPDTFLCERLLMDVEKAGFDLGELANSCCFESDELDYILKAIHLVTPDFVPKDAPMTNGYTNKMLQSLDCENPKRLECNQYALDISKSAMMERWERQMEMERRGMVEVFSISTPPERSSEEEKLSKLRDEVRNTWRTALCDSFSENLKTFEKKAKNNLSMTIYPYLKLFPPEVYTDIIFKNMQDLFSSSEAYSPTQIMFQSSIGHAVNRMYNIESKIAAGMVDKVARLYDQYASDYLDKDFVLDNHRKMWTNAMSKHWDTVNMDMSMKKWPRHVTKMVGKFLLDLLLYNLKIDANLFKPKSQKRLVPAFCTIYRPDVTTFTMAEIKVHPVVSKLFKMDSMEVFQFDPSTVPMLVPPVPWISKNVGSLLLGSYALVRMENDLNHLDALKNVKDTQFTAVLDSLNTLSACAWKMNKPILDLQIQIFKANGDASLKVSPPASVLPPLPTAKPGISGQEKAALYRQRVQLQHKKQDMHGLWCSDLYRLSIANKFRDEIFWFPHSMDFRGRTYPLPPHFNHLGSDNVRGVLLFAKGKPLGPKGHDWLKIHLVNLTGFKKRSSNDERLAYANSLMDEIMDSADYPLTGKKWWHTSDEPWQTLACCMELAKIERFEGKKEDYICHFPVHQDGSCNGLQHYAALGRDESGAESVNLVPFDTPQDVYSDVVELVEKERKRDADEGNNLAQALEGFVKRKVIKQTIMTTVYGVTRFGARAQIHKQLKDIPEFPPDLTWEASFYLTDKTFSSLREMFRATKDIQDWLTDAAQLISAIKPVDWVTPLGFPVVQPYFKPCSDGSKIRNRYTTKPNTVKQKNAFPPNYIHSLDSTHMMLTSLYSMHEGITFVSVHDCFWTHACDVSIMNQVCREQFVSMHSQRLLEDLSQHLLDLVDRASMDPSLEEDFKKVDTASLKSLLCDVPKRGTLDLNDVLKSTYFFS